MDDFIRKISGNVYKDLGYADADIMKLKADIVSRISDSMREKNIAQERLAEITGIPQAEIDNWLNGHFREVGSAFWPVFRGWAMILK